MLPPLTKEVLRNVKTSCKASLVHGECVQGELKQSVNCEWSVVVYKTNGARYGALIARCEESEDGWKFIGRLHNALYETKVKEAYLVGKNKDLHIPAIVAEVGSGRRGGGFVTNKLQRVFICKVDKFYDPTNGGRYDPNKHTPETVKRLCNQSAGLPTEGARGFS